MTRNFIALRQGQLFLEPYPGTSGLPEGGMLLAWCPADLPGGASLLLTHLNTILFMRLMACNVTRDVIRVLNLVLPATPLQSSAACCIPYVSVLFLLDYDGTTSLCFPARHQTTHAVFLLIPLQQVLHLLHLG